MVLNAFGQIVLHFHPESDYLIRTGEDSCSGRGDTWRTARETTVGRGIQWTLSDTYIRNCVWARDATFLTNPSEIICGSYRDKAGNQKIFQLENPLGLIEGTDYYRKKEKLFDHFVGFAEFSEYLISVEVREPFANILIFSFTNNVLPSTSNGSKHLIFRFL